MEKLTIVLLGKQGAGKSASGNTLLGCDSFRAAASSKQVTRACSVRHATVDQQIIEVIDTPGWGDSSQFDTEMKPNIIKHINQYKPQVFLLVLPIGRFTVEETKTVLNILKGLGDEVIKSMIVLFTKGDDLENRTIEDYLKESHTDLEGIIRICEKRYHVFNNKERKDCQQISSLLKKINDLVEKNEVMYEKNKMRKKPSSVPKKIKSPTEYEKSLYDQMSSCNTDGKEKEREPLVYRNKLEKFIIEENQKFQDFIKENMEKQLKTMKEELKQIQKENMEKQLKTMKEELKQIQKENMEKQLKTMKEELKQIQMEIMEKQPKTMKKEQKQIQKENMEKQLKTMKELGKTKHELKRFKWRIWKNSRRQ